MKKLVKLMEKARDKVLEQGKAAVDPETGGCQFRVGGKATAKLRCAVGHLIPNKLYTPEFDDTTGLTGVLNKLLPHYDLPDTWEVRDVFMRLQLAHDSQGEYKLSRREFRAAMKDVIACAADLDEDGHYAD